MMDEVAEVQDLLSARVATCRGDPGQFVLVFFSSSQSGSFEKCSAAIYSFLNTYHSPRTG
jgi:hypothetical protein